MRSKLLLNVRANWDSLRSEEAFFLKCRWSWYPRIRYLKNSMVSQRHGRVESNRSKFVITRKDTIESLRASAQYVGSSPHLDTSSARELDGSVRHCRRSSSLAATHQGTASSFESFYHRISEFSVTFANDLRRIRQVDLSQPPYRP